MKRSGTIETGGAAYILSIDHRRAGTDAPFRRNRFSPTISGKGALFASLPAARIVAVAVLFLVCVRPDGAGASDFRDVSWGMSRLDVLAVEEAEPVSLKAPFIHYRSRISGRLHHLVYGFIEDRLAGAVYIVVTRRPDEYRVLKQYIENKYGRPRTAYDGGSGNYRFFWDADDQEITIRPGRLRECRIEYTAKHYKELRADKEKKRKKRIEEERRWAY
ncbi:hypothetical protein JCM14469_09120 [Desulfatiferula olefinivorans]